MYIIIGTVNLLVGVMIGICGIAGFLLPMLYSSILAFAVSDSLALSFFAFLISGLIGSFNFYKKGNLDLNFSINIGLGSIIGALIGVQLNSFIPTTSAKLILNLVVLLSGLVILFRKNEEKEMKSQLLSSRVFIFLLGVLTAIICALSGAGGPVLVMPLLVGLGIRVHKAIGIALFDSVFIAVPAFVGYFSAREMELLYLLILVAITHGVGVLLGSWNAHKINAKPLKTGVAIFSVLIALYMIGDLLN